MENRTEAWMEVQKLRSQAGAHKAAADGLRAFLREGFGYATFGKLLTKEEYGTLEGIAARLDAEANSIFQKARKAEEEYLAAAMA